MMKLVIDSHIHFDLYDNKQQQQIISELETYNIETLIAVSMNEVSAQKTLSLANEYSVIEPAIGYHPEQPLPRTEELSRLIALIDNHYSSITAIGEVGLPYYLRQEHSAIPIEPYIEMLELFIKKSGEYYLPIALHAIYDDASIVCTLLEKYSIKKAHFHWYKGKTTITERLIQNGYMISFTPDTIYRDSRLSLISQVPLTQIMVETDGPWPFDGPFKNEMTHPKMLHHVIRKIAEVKRRPLDEVYDILYDNTKRFYLEKESCCGKKSALVENGINIIDT